MQKEKWVGIKNRNAIGFILDTNYREAVVHVIQNGKDKGEQKIACHQLVEIDDDLSLEDQEALKYQYTNMALDTDDREWLTELSQTEGSK